MNRKMAMFSEVSDSQVHQSFPSGDRDESIESFKALSTLDSSNQPTTSWMDVQTCCSHIKPEKIFTGGCGVDNA